MTEATSPKRRTHSLRLLPLVLVLAFTGLPPVGASAPGQAVKTVQVHSQVAKLSLGDSKVTVVRFIDAHIRSALRRMGEMDHRLAFERHQISKFSEALAKVPTPPAGSAARASAGLRKALARHQAAWRERIRVSHYMARLAKSRATVLAALHGHPVTGLKPGPVTYRRWAIALLGSLGAPSCQSNVRLVVSWETAESTTSRFNPLATTYWLPGAMTYGKSRIENYLSFAQGIQASRDTLLASPDSYNYAPIVDDLLLCAPTEKTALDIRDSEWCHGCTNGSYLVAVLPAVRGDWEGHESRHVGGG